MTTPTTVQVRLQIRADTAANWTSVNPVLLANELGLESDTKKFKIGNGSSTWGSLAYFPSIVSGGTVLGNLEIGTTGTLTFEGSTADGFETTLGVVDPTADRTILLPNQSGTVVVGGNASITNADIAANAEIAVSKLADGAARQVLQTDAAGTGVEWTDNVDIPGTLDVTGAATFDAAVTITGDLTVNGTTTNINTQNLVVEDKNVILGDVATPTDVTADGGGITLKGTTDKTINWVDSTDAWTSSERFSVPLGSASAPSLTFTGDENTGIYSPGADQVAISTNSTGRLFVDSSGRVGVGTNSPAAILHSVQLASNAVSETLRLQNSSDGLSAGTELVFASNNTAHVKIQQLVTGSTAGNRGSDCLFFTKADGGSISERMRLDSSGRLGIGSSSPGYPLTVKTTTDGGQAILDLDNQDAGNYGGLRVHLGKTDRECRLEATYSSSFFSFYTDSAERMRLTSTGLGIGTTPSQLLHLSSTGFPAIRVTDADNSTYFDITNSDGDIILKADEGNAQASSAIRFNIDSGEKARIDSSGRLLVGTSTSTENVRYEQNFSFVKTGANTYGGGSFVGYSGTSAEYAPLVDFKRSRGTTDGSMTVVASGDRLGSIAFLGADGNSFEEAANIRCYVDGTPGDGDMPGRLVFSTTADGASSPTERMRITNSGNVLFGKTDTASATVGIAFQPSIGYGSFTRSGGAALGINRMTNDGELVQFLQDDILEGSISVSGTTVSYNGAHLSRWSQLPSGAEREEILRGTVLSNIDEMCEWGEEHNEQLNRMKVSDVEGDKNVSGVFQAWDDDDDTYTNDFYCAMTGDFIIRIGAGVTIERGDLLMSAGDGTAKPQDDDIIRSKTIAKVTSTNVSCTYDDGSYCVSCVLMAC